MASEKQNLKPAVHNDALGPRATGVGHETGRVAALACTRIAVAAL